jgi:NADPH:quinone reductase-like Zn-dependent oxidoreductase
VKAVVYRRYGAPDVLRCEEVEKPTPKEGEVLVRVRAASLNPMDRHLVRGEPYLIRAMTGISKPKEIRLGSDLAGEIVEVGRDASAFQPGDAVFGAARGSFAEYVCAHPDRLAPKPANVSFEQAAAVPVPGLTALQALNAGDGTSPGQRVLIIGAAGGVGTFAVQIAKSLGAHVTGVCSTGNVDHVRSIGADRVIDYTREDFTRESERYDRIVIAAGNRPLSAFRGVVTPRGTSVWVGASPGRWLGVLAGFVKALVLSRFGNQRLVLLRAAIRKDDLITLKEMIEAGRVTPVIGRRYALTEVPEAIRYLEEGHARGKTVIVVRSDDDTKPEKEMNR